MLKTQNPKSTLHHHLSLEILTKEYNLSKRCNKYLNNQKRARI